MPLQFELCPGRMIGDSHPCFIIAEIGQNHQGDIEIAKKMIKMAKVNKGGETAKISLCTLLLFCPSHLLSSQDCGADCAKFQKSELEFKFSKKALERPYNSKHSFEKNCHDKVGLTHSHHITSQSLSGCRVYLHEIGIQLLSCMIVKIYKLLESHLCCVSGEECFILTVP